MISFYLNGKYHEISHLNPNTTVLEYLRLHEYQTDTKEGCGSGDCGACTIMAQRLPNHAMSDSSDSTPFYTFNSCIAILSLMDGHHLMTASYLADNPAHHPERALLHPAQQAMVDCHGSQCGFCTPGFVMSLANLYENNRMQQQKNAKQGSSNDDPSYDDIVAAISGNLCRCTGYRPIIEAGLTMGKIGQQRDADEMVAKDLTISLATDAMASNSKSLPKNESFNKSNQASTIEPALSEGSLQLFIPKTVDEFNQLLAVYPSATIWAGGTDLGLSITQHLVDHEVIIQLSAIDKLKVWSLSELNKYTDNKKSVQELTFGAGMTYQQMLPILEHNFPAFAALFARTASPQIRNMGTLGGNIANASPIGDLPPILLALEARIHLRHCNPNNRDIGGEDASAKDESNEHNKTSYVDEIIPLSEFFLDYKKTKLRAGSYIVAIHMPLMQANQHLFIHKISKRYEDDISACLVAVRIDLSADGMTIDHAKIGLGGMAAIPLLAKNCQQALVGQPLELASFKKAAKALPMDVSPLTDVRASREYRLHVVQRLLIKCGKQLLKETQTERESS
ncbi:xanthine dehydrogenase small subunit [Psychrobacter luti]|uniref:Xanthine dehydrogenase small subunit n=1 Tax=Psychrobacter luti TaxID=198481 RepID=A0A839T883_9GAMM|nr:FAD binding domain-containing protein [Psychrobacter luti]MBB3105677.1 xanthine dehydrogenase small subunit [Psychrobacter luti]